jgi:hypothetical protein
MAVLASLDFHRRCHPRQGAQLLLGLGQVPLDPLPMSILKRHVSFAMRDPADHMLVLFPHRAPDCHIIKAAVGDPRQHLVLFEGCQGLTHGLSGLLPFGRFALQARSLTLLKRR